MLQAGPNPVMGSVEEEDEEERVQRDTERRAWCEGGVREGIGVVTSQGIPGATSSWKNQGGVLPLSPWRKHTPADTFIYAFWSPELGENKYVLFEATYFVAILKAALVNEYTQFPQ